MFRNRQIDGSSDILRLTVHALYREASSDSDHSSFKIPNAVLRFTGIEEFSPDGLLTRHIAIHVPVVCSAGLEKFFATAFKNARSLSDFVFVTRRRRCGRMRGRRPGKTGGVFAGIQ